MMNNWPNTETLQLINNTLSKLFFLSTKETKKKLHEAQHFELYMCIKSTWNVCVSKYSARRKFSMRKRKNQMTQLFRKYILQNTSLHVLLSLRRKKNSALNFVHTISLCILFVIGLSMILLYNIVFEFLNLLLQNTEAKKRKQI